MDTLDMTTRDPAQEEVDTRTLLRQAQRQAEQRHYEDFLIVDVDAHHYETESFAQIIEFVEDPVVRHVARAKTGATTSRTSLMVTQPGFQDMSGRIPRYNNRGKEKVPATPHRDISLTLRWMDALGVDMVCLFPTPMLNLGLHPQADLEVALARGYNRWLCETILATQPRFRSMLYLPFNNPDETYRMVQDFGDRKGVAGFMVTSCRYKPVYDNVYMKTYRLMEEMGKPIAFHAAYNWYDQSLSLTNRFIAAHALGFSWFNVLHLTNWIVNGMPERFPKLKTVWIESGLAWIPFVMQRLDNEYMMRSSECPSLKRLPGDYIREMYFSSQPMEMVKNREMLEITFKMIKADTQLLYSSDYPHWDMDLPSVIYDLPFLSEQAKRNILGGNAQKLFGLEPVFSEKKLAARAAKQAAQ